MTCKIFVVWNWKNMLLEGRHILGVNCVVESWWTAYLDGILKFWKAGGKAADLDDAPGPKPRIVQLEDLSSLRGFVGTLLVLLSGLAKEWLQNAYPNHHDFNWHHHKRSFCHRWLSIIACRCFSDCWNISVKVWLVEGMTGMTLSFILKIKVLNPTSKIFSLQQDQVQAIEWLPKGYVVSPSNRSMSDRLPYLAM